MQQHISHSRRAIRDLEAKYKAFKKSYRCPQTSTDEAVRLFLRGLDCPRALTVWLLYSNGEHEQLVNLGFRVDDYVGPRITQDIRAVRSAYCATKFLSKADFLDLPIDRRSVALSAFRNAEKVCAETNRRFRALQPSEISKFGWILERHKQLVHETLDGWQSLSKEHKSSFDPEEWFDACSWGPGSTTQITGNDTSAVNKFQCETGITYSCYDLVGPFISSGFPLWGNHIGGQLEYESKRQYLWEREGAANFDFVETGSGDYSEAAQARMRERTSDKRRASEVVVHFDLRGDRVITVPKNAKTDRVISVQPGLNCFFQLGLGKMISRRLKRNAGIDLSTQDRNQLLCFYGSMTGKLATVDFSAASDTISREVVKELLPLRWFTLLEYTRTTSGELDGERIRWEKFSAMGNGFTFPLQSLIFATAAIAACERVGCGTEYVGVFGDDVVIPVEAYASFEEYCQFLGFSINTSKSFASGYFRESCGSHYFLGSDIKPIYLKERLGDVGSVFKFANAVRRFSRHRNLGWGCDRSFQACWGFLLGEIPKEFRFRIPEGYGDGGFVSNFDEAVPWVRRAKHWLEGYWYLSASNIGVELTSEETGLLLARLSTPSTERAYKNNYSLRSVTRPVVSRSIAQVWNDVGPWF